MALELAPELIAIINSRETNKVLVTTDADGTPHAVVKDSLQVNARGDLEYLELLESSRSLRNLTHSLWYEKRVAVLATTPEGGSFQITGRPVRIIVSGPEFERRYAGVRQLLGDVDLAALCSIEPLEVREETFSARFVRQEEEHPFYRHLDRIAR